MRLDGLFAVILLALELPISTLATSNSISKNEVLERDVCVIGGGASGTYAAVQLQQMGKSVALIEKQSRLGGQSLKCTTKTSTIDITIDKAMSIPTKTRSLEHLWITEFKSSPT